MATTTFTGTNNWSSAGNWSAGIPTAADDAIIAQDADCTIDTMTAVALSVTLAARTTGTTGGKLRPSTTANCKLVVEKGISGTNSATAAYSSHLLFDMSSNAYTCELVPNNVNQANATTATNTCHGIWALGNYQFRGNTSKTCHTTLAGNIGIGATSCVVADATGWAVGDAIVIATTDAYTALPHIDILEIGSITGGPTNATINFLTTGVDTAKNPEARTNGQCTYAHLSGCPVGNLRRNLIIRPGTADGFAYLYCNAATANQNINCFIDGVEFRQCQTPAVFGYGNLGQSNLISTWMTSISRNVFYNFIPSGSNGAIFHQSFRHVYPRQNNIFLSKSGVTGGYTVTGQAFVASMGPDEDYVIFRGAIGSKIISPDNNQVRAKISGLVRNSNPQTDGGIEVAAPGCEIIDSQIWSNTSVGITGTVPCVITNTSFGDALYTLCNNQNAVGNYGGVTAMENCNMQSAANFIGPAASIPSATIQCYNRDDNYAIQEIYRNHSVTTPIIRRDTNASPVDYSDYNPEHGTSSLMLTCNGSAAIAHEFQVLAKAGAKMRLQGWFLRSTGFTSGTYPTVNLYVAGVLKETQALTAAVGTWQRWVLDLEAVDAPAADGLVTVEFTATCTTAGAYGLFSACPVAPFVSRRRHYGYTLDEINPVCTRDYSVTLAAADSAYPTIAELESAEATAAAIGGVTVSWGATSSITAFTASRTFQQLWDYVMAQGCLNVASAMPLTAAGVAGNVSLFAQGNITVDQTSTYDLNGAGSLSMGGYTLTYEFAGGANYTYTGGIFSQLTTVPTFNGGTLNIGAAGTYTYTQAAGMILSMTPTAAGTYALGACSFTGQVDLRNTSGTYAIIVELPSGTDYVIGQAGAGLTVQLPVVTADVSITGMPDAAGASNRLQIINSTAITAASRANSTAYALGAIRLRQTGIGTENTAGLYLRCTTAGTSAASPPTWNTTPGGTTADGTVTWTTYKVLFYDADPASTSYATTYVDGKEFLAGEVVTIRFAEMDAATSFKRYSTTTVASAAGFTVLVDEVADDVYATNALNGSSYETTFSPNFTLDYIVLDTNTDFSGKAAYAYFCYTLTTSNGMYEFWGGVTALDEGNYRIETDVLNLYFDESAGFVKQTDAVRIFRKDGLRPALDPTTGTHGLEINWRVPVNVISTGGTALTTEEHNQLMALPNATANATAVTDHTKTLTVGKFLALK